MTNTPPDVKSVFGRALEIESPAARAAYLDEACGTDAGLRAELEGLLATLGRAGEFMRRPAAAVAVGMTASYESLTERPGTIIGPYKLMEQIGEGGMGQVFVAEQQHPIHRRVALKIIKPGMDSRQVIARFEAERQALAIMDHQNIAKVYDAGTTDSGRPYFVMELVHGVPLTEYCDANKLTPRQRLELFVPVCQAIHHAHQKGVIHRDIKPSNVLVTMYDDKPVPKIIDFGVAKAIEQRLTEKTIYTQFGTLVGTFEYMSPEQAEMNAFGVDTRSDVYSLGVLLYELLTGTTPLERSRLREAAFGEIIRLIKEEEPLRPSVRLSTSGTLAKVAAARQTDPARLSRLVCGELDWVVMRCLEKDRTRRYDSASGLARDLEHYLKDEPVEACPPSAGYKLRKFGRKHKVVLATAAAFAALLLAGAAASTWQAVRATRAESEATRERDAALAAEEQAQADRNRALAAEAKTKAEKANAQAALDFLWREVLSQASPFNEPDRDLKLRTVLDRAFDRLDKGTGQSPLVEAAIRRMVGELYTDLGELAKARRLLKQALKVQTAELGEEDAETLNTMHALGVVTPRTMHALGVVTHPPGIPDEGERLLARTLELRRRVLGEEHQDTLVTMRSLATVYGSLGRDDEAEHLLRQVLEAQSRKFGETHQETVITRYALGLELSLRRGGLQDEGVTLQVKCVEQFRQLLGPDHPLTFRAMDRLALTYCYRNEPERAEPLAFQALKAMRSRMGPQEFTARKAMVTLIYAYRLQEKYAEAKPLIAELVAEPWTDPECGRPRVSVDDGLRELGRELLREGKPVEAEAVLRECLKAFEKRRSPRAARSNRPYVQVVLGASLLGQKKYPEAQSVLLEAYEDLKQPQPHFFLVPGSDQSEALGLLVQLYEEWGKPDEAAKWRKELEASKASQKKTEKQP
jgi:serine/threonine protein kinase/tetratricopeptide (TPR) repeat protein